MSMQVYRRLQFLLLLSAILVLWAAFYFQYVVGLQPCPLCIVQRFCAFAFALFCFVGLCLSVRRRVRALVALQMLFAIAGLFFALRQLWLQSLPAGQVPACLPGLDVLIHYFPWHDVLIALLWGSGDCAEVTWRLLGFSMPAWTALYFLTMFFASGFLFFAARLDQDIINLEIP